MARGAAILEPGSTVLVSLPNVAYWRGLWRLVRTGRWPVEGECLFDRGHLRWFTRDDALELLRQAGLRLVVVEAITLPDGG